jgi:hypothetical protein
MVDGPNEIKLCKDFKIDTWDSSAAVWAGLNDITFDSSPTGLINGKFEKEVDFSHYSTDITLLQNVRYNISVIEEMCL